MRNCSRCSAWRPFGDYRVTRGRGGAEYLGHVCCACERAADRERALARYYKKHELEKVKQRNRARARREANGTFRGGKYNVARPVAKRDQRLELLLKSH